MEISKTASLIIYRIREKGLEVFMLYGVPPLADGAADRPDGLILFLAFFALALTAVNMFGGFAVTRRMLAMFRK